MFNLIGVKNILIAFTLGLTIGFGAGFYTKGKFVAAKQVDAVVKAQHQTAQNISESVAVSETIEVKVAVSNKKVETVRKAVTAHLKFKELQNENLPSPCIWNLDVGTVGMLNSARAGTAFVAPAGGDAAGEAPSGIGISDFVDNDLQVVGLYHDLSERHDALVDYVESLVKKQAE